jgi:hypothetical protein
MARPLPAQFPKWDRCKNTKNTPQTVAQIPRCLMSNIGRRFVTENTPSVTINTVPVTINQPSVTINQKRGRGRPRTGVALSDAERMRKYRDRRRAAVAAS